MALGKGASAVTLTLNGRLQTRLFLLLVVGVVWTIAISPALPRPAWAPLSMVYRITFQALGIVAAAGIAWELLYHGLQQFRWNRDWPSIFALITGVNEGIATWVILHVLGIIPGTAGLASPIWPLFVIHFTTTWFLVWLVAQGPLRVAFPRWRFRGGRIL